MFSFRNADGTAYDPDVSDTDLLFRKHFEVISHAFPPLVDDNGDLPEVVFDDAAAEEYVAQAGRTAFRDLCDSLNQHTRSEDIVVLHEGGQAVQKQEAPTTCSWYNNTTPFLALDVEDNGSHVSMELHMKRRLNRLRCIYDVGAECPGEIVPPSQSI